RQGMHTHQSMGTIKDPMSWAWLQFPTRQRSVEDAAATPSPRATIDTFKSKDRSLRQFPS
ncbi:MULTISPECIES: hypothetical protein, partial [unclassified Pseudomonas]|uniref:hypothetical protein n=1 Tax=unclassified Pseudomonas TaxID=196821 RepID=UPI001C44DC46